MPEPTSLFITAPDGLQLHTRIYGSLDAPALPVVCLAGLTRTCADFDALAALLSGNGERPRCVLALDARGRGRSEYDPDGRRYNLAVELADVFAVLTALEIPPAIFIGTSRGGLLAMLAAAARPKAIAGVVFNDVGPVIETKGLLRIKSYVGRLPQPKSLEEAADILRRLFGMQFPNLSAEEWMSFARRSFVERNGSLVVDYDVKIARTLEVIAADRPIPPLWKEFDALGRVPVMVIRGANSDLLSPETLDAMTSRRPDLEALEILDQGHPPLLVEDEVIDRIEGFILRCESERIANSE